MAGSKQGLTRFREFLLGRAHRRVRRTFLSDLGEGSISVLIGALGFMLIAIPAALWINSIVDDTSRTTINNQRKQALHGVITNHFQKINWVDVISESNDGIISRSGVKGSINEGCYTNPCIVAPGQSSAPIDHFAYYSWVTRATNTLYETNDDGTVRATNVNNYGTVGADGLQSNLTNSDGAYQIQIVAPKAGYMLSDCKNVLNSRRPTDPPAINEKCVYISGVRAPTFSDGAAAGDWTGLTTTDPEQVRGTTRVSGGTTHTLAVIDTCSMTIPKIRVSFLWTPDAGSDARPASISRFRSDGTAQETLSVISATPSGPNRPYIYAADFTRGTSSLCGSTDTLRVEFSGSGEGSITSLFLVPVAEEVSPVGTPGPVPMVRLQNSDDAPKSYQLVWDKPTTNTAFPPIGYQVASTCDSTGTTIPADQSSAPDGYTGGRYIIDTEYLELADYMNRCPIWKITPVGTAGNGPSVAVSLSALPLDYIRASAYYTPVAQGETGHGKVTVDFKIPVEMHGFIEKAEVYYCYYRPGEANGCEAPSANVENLRATLAGPIELTGTTMKFDSPDPATVLDRKLYVQLIFTPSAQAGQMGRSNIITVQIG